MNNNIHQYKATEFSASHGIYSYRIFYSNRDRQTIMFEIRPSLTTSKEGLETHNIHFKTTRILQ